ncbi:MAG: hypothetical protein LBU75_16220 [Desulfovibrio sp.]|jgi:hypothetical protein|nr:hypothetical protein [Desulfovibrio sp.]
MCGLPQALLAAAVLQGSYTLMDSNRTASAAKAQQEYQAATQRNAAMQANYQIEETQRDAERTERALKRQARSQQAGVRSLLAASGMDAGSGSALDVLQDQSLAAEADVLDVRRQSERRQRALEYQAAGADSNASLLLGMANDPWSRVRQGWRNGMIIGNTVQGAGNLLM